MPKNDYPAHRFTIAPMMGYSHRHFIHFMRLISKNWLIFTEMLPAKAITENRKRLCDWHHGDSPIIVQLGGSDGNILGQACKIIADYGGAKGINLNMGCPSPRVQNGAFGASLMLEPEHSADLIAQMVQSSALPISVKLRIGVDNNDDEESLHHLIRLLIQAGASEIYLHARKAILKGLNPKQNRNIPPLRYDVAHRCKEQFSDIPLIVNGGINTMAQAKEYLEDYDGVMVGRMAVTNPLIFADVDREIFNDGAVAGIDKSELFSEYLDYMHQQVSALSAETEQHSNRYVGSSIYHFMLQPLYGLLYATRGAKQWRMAVNDLQLNPENLHNQSKINQMQEMLAENTPETRQSNLE